MRVGALTGILLVAAQPLAAQDRAALSVSVELIDGNGRPTDAAKAGEAFGVRIVFRDAATNAPVRSLRPFGWLRQPMPGQPTCVAATDATKSFRATGRLSQGDVALEGRWLLSLDHAGVLAIHDPKLASARTNLMALAPLGGTPGSVATSQTGLAYASRPERGDVVAIRLPGSEVETFASSFERPVGLLAEANGGVWVADEAKGEIALLDRDGNRRQTVKLPAGELDLHAVGPQRVLAVAADGSAALAQAWGGVVTMLPPGTLSQSVAVTADSVLVARPDRKAVEVRYVDQPSAAHELPVGIPGTNLAVSQDGTRGLAWSAELQLALFDVAILAPSGKPFQVEDSIHSVTFAGDAAFISYAALPMVTVVHTKQLQENGEPARRNVWFGERGAELAKGPSIVSLHPEASVLVAAPGSTTLYQISEGGGLSAAPMTAMRLNAEAPREILVAERRLREVSDGVFEGSAVLEQGGAWEVVATTGTGGTTACAGFDIEGDDDTRSGVHLVVTTPSTPQAGRTVQLHARLESLPEGLLPDTIQLDAIALDGGWRETVSARLGPDGVYRVQTSFPWAGHFPITVAGHPEVEPHMVEVQP